MASAPWRGRQRGDGENGEPGSAGGRATGYDAPPTGLDTVLLHLEVQSLIVDPEESRRRTFVPQRCLKRPANRLAFRLGGGLVADLLQGEVHLAVPQLKPQFAGQRARVRGPASAVKGPVLRRELLEPPGLNAVLLHLEVQGLVVGAEVSRRLALVPPAGVEGLADRLLLGVGCGRVGDLLQRGVERRRLSTECGLRGRVDRQDREVLRPDYI